MHHLRNSLRAAVLALVATGPAGAAWAQGAAVSPAAPQGPQPAAAAEAAPAKPSAVEVRLQYTGEAAYNATGGLRNGGTYLNNIDAQLQLNTARAFGWAGGKVLVEGFYANAPSINRTFVGAVQDPSPIDTGEGALFRLYQAYYEQRIGGTSVLLGIYDLETEFGVTKPMNAFLNGAYAWNTALDQSGLNGPSTFPNTAPGLRIRQRIADQVTVRVAAMNGVPDSVNHPGSNGISVNKTNGAFLIGEIDYAPTRTTKLMAGYWNYTGKFNAINVSNPDGTQRQTFGSAGAYVGGATRLYDQGNRRGLDVFANIGVAEGRTNETNGSLNLGLTYTGPFAARPADQLGLAVGAVKASDALRRFLTASGEGAARYEGNVELTYRAPINDWLTIQPDIQYFNHPGYDPRRRHDLLLMVHFEIGHGFGLF